MGPIKALLATGLIGICIFAAKKAQADDPNPKLQELCASDIEGSFVGKMWTHVKIPVRMNVVCINSDRLVFTMTSIGNDITSFNTFQITLSTTNVRTANDLHGDGTTYIHDIVEFSMIGENNSDRANAVSDSPMTFVQLDLEALKNHQIMGRYMTGDKPDPIALYALKRDQTFPKLDPSSKLTGDLNEGAFHGVYTAALSRPFRPAPPFKVDLGSAQGSGADELSLTLNLLGDTPEASIGFQHGDFKVRMVDGLPFEKVKKTGVFVQSTASGDGELSARAFTQIRGRVVDDQGSAVEFYLIDSTFGVIGASPCPAPEQNQTCFTRVNKLDKSNLYFQFPTAEDAMRQEQPAASQNQRRSNGPRRN